jgi:beta-lactam-binding protein with PASTA domain/tRNA A-37 threonylcarbamoyl transferase component Bud32
MAVQDTLIGTVFDGRYRVIRRLGSGGMANVYLAEDEELGRRVAIKVLDEKHANDEQFVERFRREAKNAASLSHPNIVSIYDRGEAEGTYYIAMEYIEGRTLKDLILSRGPLPTERAVSYARQILGAVRFAHRKGIVHRDIKPHNVLVDTDGRLKVTDFGIARAGASQMTEAGSIIGTAQYLSPEQARGASVDQRSDLYSVGIVLYEMLTGSVPFTGDTPVEIAMKHISAVPQPPSAARPSVPDDLDLVVLRALAKDPRERFQSAEEMDSELGRLAAGLSVTDATADAATAVLAGAGVSDAAPTAVVRRPAPPPYAPTGGYRYEEPPVPPRRSIWPWLLALGLVVAAVVAGLYAYERIQDELNANKPVAVPLLEGQEEALAVNNILDRDLEPKVVREFNDTAEEGRVFDQDPESGERIERGNIVTIHVSQGKRKVDVPDVRGLNVAEAVSRLKDAGLAANAVDVFSDKPAGQVIAQDPAPAKRVVEDTRVRLNVSQGARPVAVPNVIGQSFEAAKAALEGEGFVVKRSDQNSNIDPNTVIDTRPPSGTELQRGATVTVIVSKGPQDLAVPNVEGLDEETARQELEDAGFSVSVSDDPTDDPSQDGIVVAQDPPGGDRAQEGDTVVIFVGRFSEDQPQ